jgi:hypothetical protein
MKIKTILHTIGLGITSAIMYATVFLNVGPVMKYFSAGGAYAALPILTVFAVSFVYGTFASNLWTLLGIEASKPIQPRVARRPRTRREINRPRQYLELPKREELNA